MNRGWRDFFGPPTTQDEESEQPGSGGENSMLDWDWRASEQYGGQSVSLREWLGGIQGARQSPWHKDVCKACDSFDVTAAVHQRQTTFSQRYSRWDKKPLVADIKTAAESGCLRCKVLDQALHYLGPIPNLSTSSVNLKFLPTSVAMFTASDYLEIFPSDGEPSMACGFPPGLGIGRTRHGDSTDPAFFEDITLAINDCIRNHPDCRPSSSAHLADSRPNRLVVVPEEDGLPVKIVHATADAEYAALSHCWGTKPLKRLLKCDGPGEVVFPWQDLPRSFRDACMVARRLLIGYLWIDSLCIVQDDEDDWQREAAKMGAIYEGAYVTISATGAAASVDGFLAPRYTAEQFSAVDNHDRLVRFTVRKYNTAEPFGGRFPHYGDTHNHPWLMRANDMDEKYLNPIQLRGWCFQERLLSKRVLHFKRYEYILECNSGFRCECSGMTARKGTLKSLFNLMMREHVSPVERLGLEKLHDQLIQDLGRSRTAPKERIHAKLDPRMMQMWELLVELYSRTTFTYRDDILPALGSLARVFHAKRPEWKYLAGLWQEQLHRSLLWVPQASRGLDGTLAIRTKPAQPLLHGKRIAPSFSWASMNGRIRYMSAEYGGKREFEALSAETTGTNPYGDVTSGCIILRGKAVAFRFRMHKMDETYPVGISLEQNDWNNACCTQSRQDVEICTDITVRDWKWSATSKVESGMETLERVKGFDRPDEYSDYFDRGQNKNSHMRESPDEEEVE